MSRTKWLDIDNNWSDRTLRRNTTDARWNVCPSHMSQVNQTSQVEDNSDNLKFVKLYGSTVWISFTLVFEIEEVKWHPPDSKLYVKNNHYLKTNIAQINTWFHVYAHQVKCQKSSVSEYLVHWHCRRLGPEGKLTSCMLSTKFHKPPENRHKQWPLKLACCQILSNVVVRCCQM